MTRIEALRLELKACEMVEGTELDWWCVLRHYPTQKPLGSVLEYYDPAQVELALGVIEGKPVWEGDELYYLSNKCVATAGQGGHFTGWSWKPPKPETVMVELPISMAKYYGELQNQDISVMREACREALEGLK